MRRISNAIWLAVALVCGTVLADDEIRWQSDLMVAKQAASQYKVPLLVHFYGDNCLPCELLEQRVYSKKDAIETLNRYFICVKINATRNPAVAAQYNVHRWPTDVFLAPDGSLLHQDVSKQDVNSYLGILHSVAVMNRDRNTILAGARDPNASPSTQLAYQAAAPGQQNSASQNTAAQTAPAQLAGNLASDSKSHTFYAAESSLNRQAAQPDGVLAGPTAIANQPTATQAATSRESTLIAGTYHPSQDHRLATHQAPGAQLPAMQPRAGQVTAPPVQSGTNPAMQLAGYQQMPTSASVEATAAGSEKSVPTGYNVPDAETVENPYSAATPVREQPTQVALEQSQPTFEGYCVIAAKQGQWLPGQKELAVQHRGKVYWFSSLEAQQRFLAAPDSSAPLLSGFDPMVFLTEGKLVPGSIRYTLHEQLSGQLLLFSSEATKNAYFPNGNEAVFQDNTKSILEIIRRSEAR